MGIERTTDIGYGFAVVADKTAIAVLSDIVGTPLDDHYDVTDSPQVRDYLAGIEATVEVSQDQWSGEFPVRLIFLASNAVNKMDDGLSVAEDNASSKFREFAARISERVGTDLRISALLYSSIL